MSDSASVPVPSPVPSVPATAGVDAGRRALGRSGLGVLALIGLVGAGGWAGSRGGTAEPAAGDPLLATVQRGDIEDLVSATGALQPHEHVDVGVQLSGQIQRIVVEVGSEVRAGDLLAEIDAETVTARVDASRAELRAQQAQLDEREVARAKAERDWRRQLALQADDASTVETVQNAETELRTAQAQIAALKAQMEQLQATLRVEEANLKYARILAPIDGTVVSISARPGQTLNASQNAPTLLRIGDLGTMTVQAQVSEADVSRLQPGLPVYFTTLGGQGRRWQTRVRKIEPTPTVTNNVVLYNVLFDVPNPGRSLMSQMTAQVFFVAAAARDVLTVPVSALSLVRTPGRRGADDAPVDGATVRPVAAMPADAPASGRAGRGERPASGPDGGRPARTARGPADEARGRDAREGRSLPEGRSAAGDAARGRMGEALAGDAAAERGVDRGAERPAEGRRPRDAADGRDGAARPQGPAAGRADGPPTDESERERWRAQRRAAREAAGEASGGGGPEAGRGPAVTPVGAATPGVERAMPGGPAASRGLRGGRPPASDGGAPARVVTRATAARPQVPSEPAAEAPRRTVRRAIVKVISEQGAVQEREVLVGLSNRIQAEIVAGLQAGEKVVVGVRQAEPARRNGPQSPGQSPSQGARDGLGGAFGPPGAAPGMGGGPGRGG